MTAAHPPAQGRPADLAGLLASPDERDRLRAAEALADDALAGPVLVGMLGDPSWRVRQAAARALARRGGPEVIAAVLAALRLGHRDPGVLNSAMQVLIQTGADVLHLLRDCLRDPDAELRAYAALTLGERGDARAIPDLLAALDDADTNVRSHATEAIGKLRASDAVPALVALATSGDFALAFPAVVALASIGDARAVYPLVPLLDDALLQDAMIEALGQLGDEEAVPPLTALLDRPGSTVPLIAQALANLHVRLETRYGRGDDLAALVRRSITAAGESALLDAADRATGSELPGLVAVLGWLDGDDVNDALGRLLTRPESCSAAAAALVRKGRAAIPTLLAALDTTDGKARHTTLQALGSVGDPAAVPTLLSFLNDDEWLPTVAGALARTGDGRAYEPLLNLLGHPEATTRRAVAAAINALGHPDTGKDMAARLRDAAPAARESAVRVAAYFGCPECLDALLACCRDEDVSVRQVAVEHLPFLDDPRALPALAEALRDADPPVRAAAARALAEIDDGAAAELLPLALRDADPWVRYFAARSLGRRRRPPACDELTRLALHDVAVPVRLAAAEALGQVGGAAAVPVLTQLVEATDDDLARAALAALGATRCADALPTLRAALDSPNAGKRQSAVAALARLGCPEAVAALVALTEVPARRDACVAVLAGLGAEQTAWLADGLQHPHPDVRRAVVESLTRQRRPEALERLNRALADASEAVRFAALAALAQARVGPARGR